MSLKSLKNKAQGRSESFLLSALVTVFLSSVFVLGDSGPRFPAGSRAAYSALTSARFTIGALTWLAIPMAAAAMSAPSWLLTTLTLAAALIGARRVSHMAGVSIRVVAPAFRTTAGRVALLGFLPVVACVIVVALMPLQPRQVLMLTLAAVIISSITTGILHKIADWAERSARLIHEALLVVLRIPDETSRATLRRSKSGSYLMRPVPAAARAAAGDAAILDAKISAILPKHEIFLDLTRDQLLIQQASIATLKRRAQISASAGLVVRIERPATDIMELHLAEGTSPAQAERIQAFARSILGAGAALTSWEPYEGRATARILSVDEIAVRARLAQVLSFRYPWELEADVTSKDGRIDQVVLHRVPNGVGGVTPKDRAEFWRTVARSLPSGTNGWSATEDDGVITMTWGPARALQRIVPGRDLLPTQIDPAQWNRLTYGKTESGEPAQINLKAGPHSLLVGGSGSGKSYATRMVVLAALARGFEYVAIDPSKKLAGLRDVDPWAKHVATTSKDEAAAVLTAVYTEVQRRVALTEEYRVEGWQQLPKHLGIRPWLIVVDEYAGLVEADHVKPRDRRSEEYEEYEAEQTVLDSIQSKMSRIAGEGRSAGMHLCVVTQTAHSDLFGAKLRQNLGTVIQLVPPARATQRNQLAMIFSPDEVDIATETIAELNDGKSPGFAVAAVEGAGLQGVRVGLIVNEPVDEEKGVLVAIRDDVEYLESIGAPLGVPLDLMAAGDVASAPVAARFGARLPDSGSADEPVLVGEIVLDLDFSDDDDDASPSPASDQFDDLFS